MEFTIVEKEERPGGNKYGMWNELYSEGFSCPTNCGFFLALDFVTGFEKILA